MKNKRVLLAVSGGIAVYKALEVMRGLQKAGCEVKVCMSGSAEEFVGAKSFEALSGFEVVRDLFEAKSPIPHIDLADWAELCCVLPATANIIAKMATGIADDAISTTLLALHCPIFVAPAMNSHMWQNASTQANVALLIKRGYSFIQPDSGLLACGAVGEGKLAEVETIVDTLLKALSQKQDLCSKKVLISAGPTHEAIDDVRYIANASSGKMGYSLAEAATERGAEVKLVSGPCALEAPAGVETISVVTALEMQDAMQEAFAWSDLCICTAAVADYRPKERHQGKLKKGLFDLSQIELVENPDILASLARQKEKQYLVGFAAETENLEAYATQKLNKKDCDLIVANDVSKAESSFGSDTNKVLLVAKDGVQELALMTKRQLADEILNYCLEHLGDR